MTRRTFIPHCCLAFTLSLFCSSWTFAQSPSALEQNIEQQTPANELLDFPVQITIISERGQRSPAVGHEVSVSGYSKAVAAAPMMGRAEQKPVRLFEQVFRTNERGVIRVPIDPNLMPAFIRLKAMYLGTRFQSEDTPIESGAAGLELYTPTQSLTDLKADVVATLSVEEKYLQTETYIRFSTKELRAVDLGAEGLPVGFLGLRMGSGVLNYLIGDEKFDHMKVELNRGSVTLVRGPEGVFLKGLISPSNPALVRVAYPIPHITQQTQLGAMWSTTLNSLKLDLRSPERYVAELVPSRIGEREVFYEKGLVREHYLMTGTTQPNEMMTFKVNSLPVQNPVWRSAILGMCGFVLIFMILLWLHLGRIDSRARSETL